MPSELPQAVDSSLTVAAIFLTFVLEPSPQMPGIVRGLCGDLSSLVRGVGFRAQPGDLNCVMGIGSAAWDSIFGSPRPAGLHPFREIQGVHHAPSTPGDLLFHIRASRMDLCFELASCLTERLKGVGKVIDEVHGFKYFDSRDLLGFVDGTENPVQQAAQTATQIGSEDPAFAGGSYVITQKYLHDMKQWNAIPVEQQERIIGRKKLSDIELAEAEKPSYAHNVLTNITENGEQLQILRCNMPFGDAGKGEFGTFFIGYSRSPARTEQMLDNMFIGNPPGNYDRLLDVSRAVTGNLFFVPTAAFLDDAESVAPASPAASEPAPAAQGDGTLGIGSLK